MRRLAGLIGVLVLVATLAGHTGSAGQGTSATPAASCGGVDAYTAAMLKAATVWADAMKREGLLGRDLLTLSSGELIMSSTLHEELQTAMKQITPPPVVAEWHQAKVEQFGLVSSFTRTMATSGLFAGLAYTEQGEANTTKRQAAYGRAAAACPAFADFYREWDLQDGKSDGIDSTPVAAATPTQGTPAP